MPCILPNKARLVWSLVAVGLAVLCVGQTSRAASSAESALARPRDPAFGLPSMPGQRAATEAQRELGRALFFDRRVSADGSMACASCHVPEQGFTAQGAATAVGIAGRSLPRNAPTVVNVAWQRHLFVDGRERSLERLTWSPMLHKHEMGHASITAALQHMRQQPGLKEHFARAFPNQGLTGRTFVHAMAAYQRSVVAADAPFDRWREEGNWRKGESWRNDEGALRLPEVPGMPQAAREGFELFIGKAGCALCHTIEDKHANFTDNGFHVIGSGNEDDLGRFNFSGKAIDRRAFKTPSLRNIAQTPPYMHDGSLPNLAEVIDFYDRGGGELVSKSPMLRKLNLNAQEKSALLAFLESLTSLHWDKLVRETIEKLNRN